VTDLICIFVLALFWLLTAFFVYADTGGGLLPAIVAGAAVSAALTAAYAYSFSGILIFIFGMLFFVLADIFTNYILPSECKKCFEHEGEKHIPKSRVRVYILHVLLIADVVLLFSAVSTDFAIYGMCGYLICFLIMFIIDMRRLSADWDYDAILFD
jgi:hypothetical protein